MTARLEADPGAQQELAAGTPLGVAALAAAGARRAMNTFATGKRDAEQEGQQNRQAFHPVDLPLPEIIPYHPPATNRGDRVMRKAVGEGVAGAARGRPGLVGAARGAAAPAPGERGTCPWTVTGCS